MIFFCIKDSSINFFLSSSDTTCQSLSRVDLYRKWFKSCHALNKLELIASLGARLYKGSNSQSPTFSSKLGSPLRKVNISNNS